MLEGLLRSMSNNNEPRNGMISSMASSAAQMTPGYVAKDLRNVCRSALLHSLRDTTPKKHTEDEMEPLSKMLSESGLDSTASVFGDAGRIQKLPSWEDFAYAINTSRPSQQIEFESLTTPRARNEYGGYADLKRRVQQTILWPITNPETFKRMGVRPPMGLLLYGPSGCGKTMLVQALASESNMNFIPVKGPEIFSKYLGETEATLRRLFAMARRIAPCILFFDEMDSIGAKRGWGGDADSSGSNGVGERVLSTLLNEMDGVEERAGVFVIGCTNQPGAMDDALLRPGRLDQLIYVGYPTLQDRSQIIDTIAKRIPLPVDPETRDRLARQTVGFSPADLEALFREAAIMTLRRDVASKQVNMADIEQGIATMTPFVQDRINIGAQLTLNGSDVLVPELYRRFQQER
ncbi:MAG: P-loop containing nucleoside triphosphate hydrolase protein [Benniella sp.]|nr:MAG: P-loop containing nucleoside triphosphate hydrolase protein [Benniella sp.]